MKETKPWFGYPVQVVGPSRGDKVCQLSQRDPNKGVKPLREDFIQRLPQYSISRVVIFPSKFFYFESGEESILSKSESLTSPLPRRVMTSVMRSI